MTIEYLIDKFFKPLLGLSLVVILALLGCLLYTLIRSCIYPYSYTPDANYELSRAEWQCVKTEPIMVGKILENRCIDIARKSAY